jgi:hypothetical protein
MEMSGMLFLFLVFMVIGLVMYLIVRTAQEQQRREQLQAVARRMGFDFSVEAEPGLWGRVADFSLFSRGRWRKIDNVMRRQIHDIDVTLFDYRYSTNSGKHNRTHYQTVVLFETGRLELPRFTLRPKHFFHRVASALGGQDIGFEAHPVFTESYLLQGPDEARVRRLFGEEPLLYYTRHADLHTEGDGRRLILYRGGRRADPQGMEDFLQQGLDVLDMFMEKDGALIGVPLLETDVDRLMDQLLAVEWLE